MLILSLLALTLFVSVASAYVECNDATDNDRDSLIDFLGACQDLVTGTIVNCFDAGKTIPSQCQSYCQNDLAGVYIRPDANCVSLFGASESPPRLGGTGTPSGGGGSVIFGGGAGRLVKPGAPEEGLSAFDRLWGFLFFAYGR